VYCDQAIRSQFETGVHAGQRGMVEHEVAGGIAPTCPDFSCSTHKSQPSFVILFDSMFARPFGAGPFRAFPTKV
jgi:hypothetical protein